VGKLFASFVSDQSGTAAVEYGMLVMFIGLALVLVLEAIGVGLSGVFTQIKGVFSSAVPAGSS
jgi:Flp pilus assembly pilin Flp